MPSPSTGSGTRAGVLSAMDIHINDILKMKKPHPCGSQEWLVLRVGMDFKLRCQGCGHEVMLPRSKAEKNIRRVVRDGQIVDVSRKGGSHG